MGSVPAPDVSMAESQPASIYIPQNTAKRPRLPSNNETAILYEYIADLKKALDEAYKNNEVYRKNNEFYRGQLLKAQQEKEAEKTEKEFLLNQLRRMQNKAAAKTALPESTPSESSYDKTIIASNLKEADDDVKDNTIIKGILSKIDGSIQADSIKRLGRKDDSKTRKIAIVFKNKAERNTILSKARDTFNNDSSLTNIFFNKSLPKDEQEIQFALRNEVKARKSNSEDVKIIRNQVCNAATSMPINCTANTRAKIFYDQNHSFRSRNVSTASVTFSSTY
uniref:Uncharacterized protein n=1 Tax=Panagrolaimus sp. PS1159 TaxID=55785 RepID=A0AC35FJL1_9BILA